MMVAGKIEKRAGWSVGSLVDSLAVLLVAQMVDTLACYWE